MNWQQFFRNYRIIEVHNDNDLLFQVGATVKGRPINKEQFITIVEEINEKLQLSKEDIVLDLCCGNGIITFEVAKNVKLVIGIDSSSEYLKNAEKYKSAANVTYLLSDVTDFDNLLRTIGYISFSKVLFYSSVAYFRKEELIRILRFLYKITSKDVNIFIGSILDNSKKFKFFNTLNRKLNYVLFYLILHKDSGIGRWWTKRELIKISKDCGYDIDFHQQPSSLHTSHYRFDATLKKNSYIHE